jgi:hypothetical protein
MRQITHPEVLKEFPELKRFTKKKMKYKDRYKKKKPTKT